MSAYAAMAFAFEAHKTQKRKYTGNPYTDHLAEVAGLAVVHGLEYMTLRALDTLVQVAWLHDCIEDTSVSYTTVAEKFGIEVANAVMNLSNLEPGNRKERKAAARARLGAVEGWVQTVKVADIISNTSSIALHDPKFAEVYLDEQDLLLDVLTKADPRLVALARVQVKEGQKQLKGERYGRW